MISVIIAAAGDCADVLRQQLDSLRAQDWDQPWGLILADNGLTFDPRETTRHVETTIVDATQVAGQAYAVNRAVRHATSERLIFLDADDTCNPDYLRHMAEALETLPFVAGRLDHITLNPPWLQARRAPMQYDELASWMGHPIAIGANTGIHRWAFAAVNGLDRDLTTQIDVDLSVRLGLRGIFPTFAPDATVNYRYRPSLREIWKQEAAYGRGEAKLYAKHRYHLQARPLRHTARDWVALASATPAVGTRAGRARLVTEGGHAWGRLAGSISNRVNYL